MNDSHNLPPEPPRPPQNDNQTDPEKPQPGLSPSRQPNVLDVQQRKKAQTLVRVANDGERRLRWPDDGCRKRGRRLCDLGIAVGL